jgi:putative Holliday junction resolvase
MGLDVGEKTIGVAISDALLLTAQSRPTIRRKSLKTDLDILQRLVAEYEVHKIVVGEPVHMNGSESPQSRRVNRFVEELQKVVKLPVVFQDERLTSFEAEQHLAQLGLSSRRRRDHIDKIAAMIILQNYLDSRAVPET